MAIRPSVDTSKCSVRTGTVKAASTFTQRKAVKLDGDTVLDCAAGDAADGFATKTAQPGEQGTYIPVGEPGVVEVLIGTGGATPGKWAIVAANGCTDAPTLGGGTVAVNLVGVWVSGGAAGEIGSLRPIRSFGVKA